MTFNNSLLNKIKKEDIISDPFPHLIIKNPLDIEYYNKLTNEFPKNELFFKNKKYLENHRYNIFNDNLEGVSNIWKDFLNFHSSKSFSDDLMNLFSDDLERLYPKFIKEYYSNKFIFGSSHKDFKEKKINLCMSTDLAINTPITKTINTVRSPHLDNPKKIITGLFYMRDKNDNSSGGDLEICRFKKNNKIRYYGNAIPKNFVNVFKTVPYEENIMIIFINTPYSIHGVTDRSLSKYARKFNYFSLSSNNFTAHDTSKHQIKLFEQLILRGKRKLKTFF